MSVLNGLSDNRAIVGGLFGLWEVEPFPTRDAPEQGTSRTLDQRCAAHCLTHTAWQQDIERHFNENKALSKARMQALETHGKINAALSLGSAPNIVAQLCQRLYQAGLLGNCLMVIGTNSLLAYEAMAGVRFDRDIVATTDIDLLWDHKARVRLAIDSDLSEPSLLALLQRVDKSFQIVQNQSFRAANDKGFMVDLIRQMPSPPWKDEPDRFFAKGDLSGDFNGDLIATDIWNMNWLLNAPRVQQIAVAINGSMFPICAPDPRACPMFKLWLAQSDERNPLKKSRDLAQAKALAVLIKDKLPHLAKNWQHISSFPAAVAKDAVTKDAVTKLMN
jgi:hypothetical protein